MISGILTWFISIWLAGSILTGTLVSINIEMAANGGSKYGSMMKITVLGERKRFQGSIPLRIRKKHDHLGGTPLSASPARVITR